MKDFIQQGPDLPRNLYKSDKLLQDYLRSFLPREIFQTIEPDLNQLGKRASSDILKMARDAETNLPVHIPYDEWGNRIDKIQVAQGWEELNKVSAEEGLISIAYERKYGEYSRTYQFAKNFLFSPSSAIYSCPLAMTDGAAKLIEMYGDDNLKQRAFKHLTSRNPTEFWTSGQWMTEKSGGSDVGRTETIAKLIKGEYHLYGLKWFTSAVTAPMAMTLARIQDQNGNTTPGVKGLSLFYLEKTKEDGSSNNIQILRLKDKLGTRALPTAELRLDGSRAFLVGEEGKGVKTIATLFNITRIHNALNAASFSRRMLTLAYDYAPKRIAFKKTLNQHPLHLQTLWELEVEAQAAFHLLFFSARLLGKTESGEDNNEHSLGVLRLITPVLKLYTAKQNINITSEVIESFGGVGYLEDSGFGKWLRDGQTLSIWEGTTNVLALDLLRSIEKDHTFGPWSEEIHSLIKNITNKDLLKSKEYVMSEFKDLCTFTQKLNQIDRNCTEAIARKFAYSIAKVTMACLMLDFSQRMNGNKRELFYRDSAQFFCSLKLNLTKNFNLESWKMAEQHLFNQDS